MAIIPLYPSQGGFRQYGVTDRAAVFPGSIEAGILPAGMGFNLGLNWRITMRLRNSGNGGVYVLNYYDPALGDGFGIIHGFAGNYYELYSPRNSTGTGVRYKLTLPVPDAGYHTLVFDYVGTSTTGTLSAFLNGTPAGTASIPNFSPALSVDAVLRMGGQPGNPSLLGAVSSLLIEATSTPLVNENFDEASGNAINTGSLGGEMVFTAGVTRELV